MSTFIVERTSAPFDDAPKPCPEARRDMCDTFKYWTFKTIAEAKERHPAKTFQKLPGGGLRSADGAKSVWVVDVESIDDLLSLYRAQGRLIIEPWWLNHDMPCIEFYDDWRE